MPQDPYHQLYLIEKEKCNDLSQKLLEQQHDSQKKMLEFRQQISTLNNQLHSTQSAEQVDYFKQRLDEKQSQSLQLQHQNKQLQEQVDEMLYDKKMCSQQHLEAMQSVKSTGKMEVSERQRYDSILLNFKECIDSFNVEVPIYLLIFLETDHHGPECQTQLRGGGAQNASRRMILYIIYS